MSLDRGSKGVDVGNELTETFLRQKVETVGQRHYFRLFLSWLAPARPFQEAAHHCHRERRREGNGETVCDLSQFSSSCLTHKLSSDWLLSLPHSNRAEGENPAF